jgi:hypothetical protein
MFLVGTDGWMDTGEGDGGSMRGIHTPSPNRAIHDHLRQRDAQIKRVQLRAAGTDAGEGPGVEGADVGVCKRGCSCGEDEDED